MKLNQPFKGEHVEKPVCAPLQIYVRSNNGETFHVRSLEDGLKHLLSDEGYRLSILEYPANPTMGAFDTGEKIDVGELAPDVKISARIFSKDSPLPKRFGITIYRDGRKLRVKLEGKGLSPVPPENTIETTQEMEERLRGED